MSEVNYKWTWKLKASPEQVWKVIGDTNRIRSLFGANPQAPSSQISKIRDTISHALIEPPAEVPISWIQNEEYRTDIRWPSGPLAQLQMQVTLSQEDGETVVRHDVKVHPHGVVGAAITPMTIGSGMRSTLDRSYQEIAKLLSEEGPVDHTISEHPLNAEQASRIEEVGKELVSEGFRASWVKQLVQMVSLDPYASIIAIAPYAFAKRWEIPRKRAIELLLAATRLEILEPRWNLRCPKCLKAQLTKNSLKEIEKTATCPQCNVTFRNNLARNVELCFSVSPCIRSSGSKSGVEQVGPTTMPHVAVHQSLQPDEVREMDNLFLEPGRYRIRSLYSKPDSWVTMDLTKGNSGELSIEIYEDELKVHFTPSADIHHLRVGNRSKRTDGIFIENLGWKGEVMTAARAMAVQHFRTVCEDQVLPPNQLIPVDQVALIRAEIVGSERLFKKQGDQNAFLFHQEFRSFIEQIVDHYDGAVYHALPGQVTAAFLAPSKAVRAALTINQECDTFNATLPETERFSLQVAVHYGPCSAANLNNHLDYFGQPITELNAMPGLIQGKAVGVSEQVLAHEEVKKLLKTPGIEVKKISKKDPAETVQPQVYRVQGRLPE